MDEERRNQLLDLAKRSHDAKKRASAYLKVVHLDGESMRKWSPELTRELLLQTLEILANLLDEQ